MCAWPKIRLQITSCIAHHGTKRSWFGTHLPFEKGLPAEDPAVGVQTGGLEWAEGLSVGCDHRRLLGCCSKDIEPQAAHIMVPKGHGLELICRSSKASQPKTLQWAYKREAWNGQKGCQWAATTEDCSAAAAKISSIKQPNRILDQNRGFESTGACFVNSITNRVFFRPACALGPRSDCKSPHASHIMVPKGHGLELICRSRKASQP